jgi:DNA end-binding protein Ku
MPARPIWKGHISFGMVSIPVRLSKATEEHDIRFHLLHKPDNARLKQLRICSEDGKQVTADETVKAFEVSPDEYIVMEPADFEQVQIESTRTIEINEFVPLESIDPIYFETSYFLDPEPTGRKPFALLRRALEDARRVGLAHLTMAQKEYLCAIRLYQGTLFLNTLHYADEIREAPEDVSTDDVKITDKEIALAASLIDALSEDFEPDKYHDRYRDALLAMITKKQEGQQLEPKRSPTSRMAATDLMDALRESVEALRKGKQAAAGAPKRASATTVKPAANGALSRRGKSVVAVPVVEPVPARRRERKAS